MNFRGIFSHSNKKDVGLGIDIGTVGIKVAQISRLGAGLTLSNYAVMELTNRSDMLNNALQSSSMHPLSPDLQAFLTDIRKRAGFATLTANLSLPAFIAQTALIDVPSSTDSQKTLESAALEAAGSYLPLPLTETTIRWVHVGEVMHEGGVKHQKILFMAIPTERVNQYIDVAKRAGFTIGDVELESVSLARVITAQTEKPTLVIDIGGRSSTCSVVKNGLLYGISQTDFSSDSTTQSVAQALAISAPRAEALKRQTVMSSAAGGHELSTIVAPIIGAILGEGERVRKTFEETMGESVAQIILSGSGARLQGLHTYIADIAKLPMSMASPIGTTVAYPPELATLLPELNAALPVALGLALKNLNP